MAFSANPDVGATLDASAHLIPQISIGISALGGKASTSIFLDLDASLDFNASVASAANPQPCVAGSADINVGVGAQGSFLGLFDASVGKSIFEKDFPLFQVRASQPTVYNYLFRNYFLIPSTRRQKRFAGNTNSTSSSSPASSRSATATDSAPQTRASSATATDSSSQTSGSNAIATDSASQTSALSVTVTGSGPQTSASDITAATSASQSSTPDATATANSRRHYRVPRAVRHDTRFGRILLSDRRDLNRP